MEMACSTSTFIPSCSSSSRILRQWSDLNYDLLLSIFSRLNNLDLIMSVSLVCSSWQFAVRNQDFWRVLDLSEWDSVSARFSVRLTFKQVLNSVLWFVRERQVIKEIYFPRVAKKRDLLLVSQRLPELVYLSFPRSKVGKPASVYSALTKLNSLKGLALHKKLLEVQAFQFKTSKFPNISDLKLLGDSGPLGNASWMIRELFPKLRKLEMPMHFVTNIHIIVSLISSLKHLECIDLSGCGMGTNKISIEVEHTGNEVSVVFPDGMNEYMINELLDTIGHDSPH